MITSAIGVEAAAPPNGPIVRDAFLEGMARLPGGVCIITAKAKDGDMAGLTVSSAVSLSADPPSMLVCINKTTRTHSAIMESGAFAANVIIASDIELAVDFATARKSPAEKFARGSWRQMETGAPVLETAAVAFDCRVRVAIDGVTHSIIVGDVVAVHEAMPKGRGLAYWDRQFMVLEAKDRSDPE